MSIEDNQDASLFGNNHIDPDGTVGKVAASAHETVDRAAVRAQDAFDRAHACMDQAVEAPRNVIRDNPVAAVVLALSVGFLWGRLGGSRD
ncbi:hypothetical protein GN316_05995 [Xylophilus sp. Kf1]|nr:hypothetical protein [Xylophilus sp. Kf1]